MKLRTLLLLALIVTSARAQVYEKVFDFTQARLADAANKGANAQAELLQDSDGNLYGTTSVGGANDLGTIYKTTPGGVITTLVEFTGYGVINKGSYPVAALIRGSDGNMYGTTSAGGASDLGTIFKVTSAGVLTTLVEFTGNGASNKGAYPSAALTQGSDGNLYGTTNAGGTSDLGTIFKMTSAGVLTTLIHFTGNGTSNKGANPRAALVQDDLDGSFYGSTSLGGTSSLGTLFKLSSAGTLTTLVNFTGNGASNKGSRPYGALVLASDGNFYGTTSTGGASGDGTIFRLTRAGALATLVQFTGIGGQSSGEGPAGALVQGSDGYIYGTTKTGGINEGLRGYGTIFKMSLAGTLTTIVEFQGGGGTKPGAYPLCALTPGRDGNFYGVTNGGGIGFVAPALEAGATGNGTLFKVDSTGVLTQLAEFTGAGVSTKGRFPQAPLAQGSDGNFYGTTNGGGADDLGTVFKLTPTGVLTNLLQFSVTSGRVTGQTGSNPSGVVEASDGSFYGTAGGGGVFGGGTIFKTSPAGGLTTLVDLNPDIGFYPYGGLLRGNDGNLYGTTERGGTGGEGTVFKLTLQGDRTTIAEFSGTNGQYPHGELIQDASGNFYGTTYYGGANGRGLVFKLTPQGVLSTLASFNLTNGAYPEGGVTQGLDGNFYGTTSAGGTSNLGTIFKVTPLGVLTTLVTFTGTNGSTPLAGLVRRSDGNFYGTTSAGGANGQGTVFKMTPAGALTTLRHFSGGSDGAAPSARLAVTAEGDLYGCTAGGSSGEGTVFRLVFPGTPTIAGAAATLQGNTTVIFDAVVNARGTSTAVFLDYGTSSTSLSTSLQVAVGLNGYQSKLVGTTVSNLAAGTIYYYRFRATNGSGTTTFPPASSAPLQFSTLAEPVVAISSPTELAQNGAQLNGTVNARNFPTDVSFEWDTDPNFATGTTVSANPPTVTGNSPVAVLAALGGLVKGQTYYYRIIATNAGGTVVSGALSFITLTDPLVSFGSATPLTAATALVTGTVDARGASASPRFEYADNASFIGLLSTPAAPSPVTGAVSTPVTATLSGLAEGTTYYVRLAATGPGGAATTSAVSFLTPRRPTAVASALVAGEIGAATATLRGTASARGLATDLVFEYGTDGTTFPNTLTATPQTISADNIAVSATAGGLQPGTNYAFRIRGTSSAGSITSNIVSFATLLDPVATTGAASSVQATSATLGGSVNARDSSSTVEFEYGTDGLTFPSRVTATPSPVSGNSSTPVSAVLTGLAEDTTYFFRPRATSAGGTVVGTPAGTFKTLRLPFVTIDAPATVGVSGAALGGTVDPRGSAANVTMEVSSDAAFTAPDVRVASPANVSGTGAVIVTANSGALAASTTYYYRIRASSAAGTAVSDPVAFRTPDRPTTALTPVTNITAATAQLNGTVVAGGTSTSLIFELANNAAFSNPVLLTASPSPVSGSGTVPVSAQAAGLQSGLTYYYRLSASSAGGSFTSAPGSFTTLALPDVANLHVENRGSQSATLMATVNANGQPTSVVFEYGRSQSALGFTVAAAESPVGGGTGATVSAAIGGLQPQSTYYFRVRATSMAGEVLSQISTFATEASALALTLSADATIDSTTLKGKFNAYGQPTAVDFVYGTSADQLDQAIAAGTGTISGSTNVDLTATLTNLTPGTTYYFRARASNAGGVNLSPDPVGTFLVPANQPPIAGPDLIFYSGAVTFNPLRNDADPNNLLPTPPSDGLKVQQIVRVPQVAKGVATILGGGQFIGYQPKFAVLNDDSLIYQVIDRQGSTAEGQVRLVRFAKREGGYGATLDGGGVISLFLDGSGAISMGTILWNKALYRLKGTFDADGRVSIALTIPEGSLEIVLQIDPDEPRLTGRVTEMDPNGVATVTLDPVELRQNAGASGLVEPGLRTAFLDSDQSLAESLGDGYLLLKVAKNRRTARITGRLPDGAPFATGTRAIGTVFPLASKLSPAGVLVGNVRVVQIAGASAGMMGTLAWQRPENSRSRSAQAAIDTTLEMHGVDYPALQKTDPPPIALGQAMPNARLTLSGRGLAVEFPLVISGATTSGFDPRALRLTFQPALGTFRGKFLHPDTGLLIPFDGVFRLPFDGEPADGRGVFYGSGSAGSVRIKAE